MQSAVCERRAQASTKVLITPSQADAAKEYSEKHAGRISKLADHDFVCGPPENYRDPVPNDVRFQLECGNRVPDLRDELRVLDR